MDSEKCNKTVDEGISKFAFERIEAGNERTFKRMWKIILILLAINLLIVAGAIYAVKAVNDKWAAIFSEFDFESYEIEADSNSNAYYNDVSIGGDMKGDLNNGGTDKSKENDETDRGER